MKIKLEWEKIITESKIVEIPFENTSEFEIELEKIESEQDLKDTIEDYYKYEINLFEYLTEDEQLDVNDEITASVINIENEMLNHKHLIKSSSCCTKETGNYCSTCGKKLKQ